MDPQAAHARGVAPVGGAQLRLDVGDRLPGRMSGPVPTASGNMNVHEIAPLAVAETLARSVPPGIRGRADRRGGRAAAPARPTPPPAAGGPVVSSATPGS